MEELLKQIFTEGGIIYLLFFIIVGGFTIRGVPFIVSKFESLMVNFTSALEKQQIMFRESLNKISEDFVKQIEKSNAWHEKHSQQLEEIKSLLFTKK